MPNSPARTFLMTPNSPLNRRTPSRLERLARVAGLCAMILPLAAVETPQPNVVLILADDLGYGDLGSYGNRWHETPAIDRLAREGIRFTDAYACPNCSPSRAALMTGKSAARTGITFPLLPQARVDKRNAEHELQEPAMPAGLVATERTLPEALKEAGYATAIIGKWHLGRDEFLPAHQGFETIFGIDDAELPGSIPRWFGPDYGIPVENAVPGEYMTDRMTREAEHFIEANRERPFFLYLSHYAVHSKHVGKPEVEAYYESKPGRPQGATPQLAAMLAGLDESVDRVLRKLEELKLTEQTMVVFVSDNGGLARNHSNGTLREGKGWLYEGGVRVPWIVKWPGRIKAGSVCSTPVVLEDIYPTMLNLAGGRFLTEHVDGADLLPLLQQRADPPARGIYMHMPHYAGQGGFPGSFVRQGEWKLVDNFDSGRFELYNLQVDPAESQDLSAARPEITDKLRDQLQAWRSKVGARMMSRLSAGTK